MKIAAENKKSVYWLIGLGAFAAYMVYSQLLSGPTYKTVTPPAARGDGSAETAAAEKGSGPDSSQVSHDVATRPGSRGKSGEFRPVLRAKKKEDRIQNIAAIDPLLRLDLLTRVMKVPQAGGTRDLFQIVKPAALAGIETKVFPFVGPQPPPPPAPPPPAPPPPPPTPVPFKYYGYSAVHPDGKRTAYLLDNDEIFEASEGTILKGRWRIVQIGLDKIMVEDTLEKTKQPVKIEPEVTG
jgi:hypothetical protein